MENLIVIPIETWPKILSQHMDISGKTFTRCTHNKGFFEAHYCGKPAIAVICLDNGLKTPPICAKHVCVTHLAKASRVSGYRVMVYENPGKRPLKNTIRKFDIIGRKHPSI